MNNRRLSRLTVFAFLAGACAMWSPPGALAQREAPAAEAEAPFGGPFSLIDQFGKRRSDREFRGKYMLMFFGYTYCPDICPTSLAIEAQALEDLGPLASRIVPIFITVDPKRDTPEKLKSYLAALDPRPPSQRPSFVGFTGSEDEIAAVARAYRVVYQAHIDTQHGAVEDYSVDHTTDTYLMGPDGQFVAYYTIGISPAELGDDLKAKLTAPR